MRTKIAALPASASPLQVRELMQQDKHLREQRLFPVVNAEHKLVGVIPRSKLNKLMAHEHDASASLPLEEIAIKNPVVAFPNEPLRNVVNRMAEVNLTRLAVVDEEDPHQFIGIISLEHLLHARIRNLQEERTKERILRLRLPLNERKAIKESEAL